jgi:hypothetical protein
MKRMNKIKFVFVALMIVLISSCTITKTNTVTTHKWEQEEEEYEVLETIKYDVKIKHKVGSKNYTIIISNEEMNFFGHSKMKVDNGGILYEGYINNRPVKLLHYKNKKSIIIFENMVVDEETNEYRFQSLAIFYNN